MRNFPTGAEVTVFYNPADPSKAVIERTLPDGAFKFMVKLSAGLVIGAVVLVFFVGGLLDAIRPHLPKPENLGAAALLLFIGLFILLMGIAQKKIAKRAEKWPVATGRIDASGLEALRAYGLYRGWRTVFRSRVVYSYSVAGQNYSADRVTFGAGVTASLPGLVSGQARRYAQGSKVDVHYDPRQPGLISARMPGARALAAVGVCAGVSRWCCLVGWAGLRHPAMRSTTLYLHRPHLPRRAVWHDIRDRRSPIPMLEN